MLKIGKLYEVVALEHKISFEEAQKLFNLPP
jgi:hypothetical protein